MKVAAFCKTEYWMELHVDSTTNSIQYPILHSILNVSIDEDDEDLIDDDESHYVDDEDVTG